MHGWLILDKPEGMSSAQAVDHVKKILKPRKIGHAGTLDPFASGVLPLALGEATKTVSYMMDTTKTYRFAVRWGEERDTDDIEGKVIKSSDARPANAQIEAVIPGFIGEILQAPPAYSALKVGGKRAYALARAGEIDELPPRRVHVHALRLLSANEGGASFEMRCEKGTYVRAITRDLGRKLNCFAYTQSLRRIQVGKFFENQAISLAKLKELGHTPAPLHPIESPLDDIPALKVDFKDAERLRHGHTIAFPTGNEGIMIARQDGKVVALGEVSGGVLKPVRVFNY